MLLPSARHLSTTGLKSAAMTFGLSIALAAPVMLSVSQAALAAPKVVTTIKPIHSLTSAIMQGVAEPELLIKGAASPHTFSLKPSQAGMLQDADLVIWVGEALEIALEKPIESLSKDGQTLELLESDGLALLQFREEEDWDHDHHDEHEHEEHADHDDHDHDHDAQEEHEHEHEEHADHDEDEHEGHHHHHSGLDPHIWLNPDNAKVIAGAIAERLEKIDPDNAATYEANLKSLDESLGALKAEISHDLEPAHDTGMIVFHDGYQYFEKAFDVHFEAAVSPSPEVQSGAESLSALKEKIAEGNIKCIFTEPQFPAKRVQMLQEGTDLKIGVLDPLGADLQDGPGLYPELLKRMAGAITACVEG